MHRAALALLAALAALALVPRDRALAVGWDADDFIISGYLLNERPDPYDVFDHDLTHKGRMGETGGEAVPLGIDFDPQGRFVANHGSIEIYESSGAKVAHYDMEGGDGDLKVARNGMIYIGGPGVGEHAADGQLVRRFGSDLYISIALLPGGVLWAGRASFEVHPRNNVVDVFDLPTGALIDTITFNDGQTTTRSMFYSKATNTVLMTRAPWEVTPDNLAVAYERDLEGNLLRTFYSPPRDPDDILSPFPLEPEGVTRGPDGDVFVASHGGTTHGAIARWRADGAFVEAKLGGYGTYGIVWAGNAVPEPASATLLIVALAIARVGIASRRARAGRVETMR